MGCGPYIVETRPQVKTTFRGFSGEAETAYTRRVEGILPVVCVEEIVDTVS